MKRGTIALPKHTGSGDLDSTQPQCVSSSEKNLQRRVSADPSPDDLCKRCRHSYAQHTKGPVQADYCRHCVCPGFIPYSRKKGDHSASDSPK